MTSKNPFNRNRAEQMGDSTWKYYVKTGSSNLLSEKPLVFEGSRGCGKTMFLLCNSWKEKILELIDRQEDIKTLFSPENIVGFYYKVDGKFVGRNLLGKGVEEWIWQSVFNTYFNLIISKEILTFLAKCIELELIKDHELASALDRVAQKIGFSEEVELKALNRQFDSILDEIEVFSNDPEQKRPIGLHAGTLISTLLEELRKLQLFETARFHVFVDEFEELNILQQKQVNTLVKQSKYWLVYDIGVKSNGRYTDETISGEIIQEPHDFVHHYPESTSFSRQADYEDLLVSICRFR